MLSVPIPSLYEALDLIVKYYPNRFSLQSKIEIETLLDHCLEGISDSSEKLLSTLFIKALKKFIGPISIDEHIYLKKFDIPQIELFNILIKEFPFVKYGHEITNTIIAKYLTDKEEALIVDIGIGQGVQIRHLIEKLKTLPKLKKVTVLGIEPFEKALEIAEKSIMEQTDEKLSINFIGWNAFIENLTYDEIHQKIKDIPGPLMINISLTLHHIQTLEKRHEVIGILRKLKPTALLLTEPNVDHYEPDFYRRFHNCYQHFYNVFQVVDNLDISNDQKNGLKLFFGREIEDIIGSNNNERFEKHEPAFRWVEKLRNKGFTIIENVPLEIDYGRDINVTYYNEGYIGFTHKSETVIAIICAQAV